MNAKVKQNYVLIQGVYPDGTPGVELAAGHYDDKQVGDDFILYHSDDVAPWKIIKVYNQEEQAILRDIEDHHGCTKIEKLFATHPEKNERLR